MSDQPASLDIRLAIAQERLRVMRLIQRLSGAISDLTVKEGLVELAEAVQEGKEKLW